MARQHSVTAERALILAVFGAVLTLTFWLGFRVQRPPNPELPAVVGGQPTPTSGKVTRQIKGEKEVTVDVAALQGKNGYPAPFALDEPREAPSPAVRRGKK
jgi:hypothetical protein